jgi:hypothetical protein
MDYDLVSGLARGLGAGINAYQTTKQSNREAERQRKLDQAMLKKQGLLEDASGNIVEDPESAKRELARQQVESQKLATGLIEKGFNPKSVKTLDGGLIDLASLERDPAAQQQAVRKELDPFAQELKQIKLAEAKKKSMQTPASSALDRTYVKEYQDWTSGGKPALEKNLALLEQTAEALEQAKPDNKISGRFIGRLPDIARSEESIRLREDVHRAVQESLRATLGAQFTEKEGERIMKQAYNENLSPAENARKIRFALDEIKANAANKDEKAAYFEEFGTLAGYKSGASKGLLSEGAPVKPKITPEMAQTKPEELAAAIEAEMAKRRMKVR